MTKLSERIRKHENWPKQKTVMAALYGNWAYDAKHLEEKADEFERKYWEAQVHIDKLYRRLDGEMGTVTPSYDELIRQVDQLERVRAAVQTISSNIRDAVYATGSGKLIALSIARELEQALKEAEDAK